MAKCTHARAHTHTRTYTNTHTHVHTYAHVHTHTHMYTHTHTHTHMHAHTYTHPHTHTHKHTHTHVHTYTHTYTHTHTHTHTRTHLLLLLSTAIKVMWSSYSSTKKLKMPTQQFCTCEQIVLLCYETNGNITNIEQLLVVPQLAVIFLPDTCVTSDH